MSVLTQYPWPGNVRELENFVERMVVSQEEDNISEETIRSELGIISGSLVSSMRDENQSLKEKTEAFERDVILDYMKRYTNSMELAAALGIDKTTLNRKIKRYGITACYIK